MSPRRTGSVLALLCLAQFVVVLDVAIVNVALPTIQRDLHLSQGSLQWVVIAYGITLGGFLLLGGRLADLLGRRRMLMTGLTVFAAASLVAGLAGSAELLITARAVQGLGAALVPPAALSLLAVTFEDGGPRERAIGLYGATAGISASVGVLASGLLTDGPGWRWIFFVNVPIGVLLLCLAGLVLTADKPNRPAAMRFNASGAITGTAGLSIFLYGISRGATHGWATGSALAPMAVAAAVLVGFVWIESRSKSPLVPSAARRNRTLVAANLAAMFTFGSFFAFIFLGSLMLQQVLGFSAAETGLGWLATTATSFVAAAVTGSKLVAVVGVRRLLVLGQSLLAVAFVVLTRVPADADYVRNVLPAFVLAGIAGGIAAPAAQIGALSGVPAAMSGLASGLVETAREVGGAIGVAAVTTVLVPHANLSDFHSAFWVLCASAVVGAAISGVAFPTAEIDKPHTLQAAKEATRS